MTYYTSATFPFPQNMQYVFVFLQIDPLAGMASLSIGGSAAPHTQSMQGFPPNLGSAFSTPQSPAKAFPPLSTPNQTTAFSGIGGLSSQLPGEGNWVRLELFVNFIVL